MARYTVQQHDSFVRASYRRKHLNALILDYSKEYEKTQNGLGYCNQNSGCNRNTHFGASASAGQLASSLTASLPAMESQQLQQQQTPQSFESSYSSASCSTASQQESDRAPSWLMPWQTGNRMAGRQFAAAIGSKRTPIGGFANHDLPVAPK